MLFLFIEHLGGEVAAVKMFMVIMTFDGVLWGLPVAAVLEKFKFLINIYDEYSPDCECMPGCVAECMHACMHFFVYA